MFNDKKNLLVGIGTLVAVLLIGLINCEATSSPKVYKLRYAHNLPPKHYMGKLQARWAELVEEKSNGRIKIEIYPAGQLVGSKHLLEAVSTGSIEGAGFYYFLLAPAIPEWNGLEAPGTIRNKELDSYMSGQLFRKEGPVYTCAKASERKNLKVVALLPWGISGPNLGLAGIGKPVILPKDMKGRKIRSVHTIWKDVIQSQGGRAVWLSGEEVYTGLQRRTLEVTFCSTAHMVARKFYEVTDWYVGGLPAGGPFETIVCVNLRFFNSLPPDLQQVLFEAGEDCRKKALDENYKIAERMLDKTKKEVKVHILTDKQKEEWVKAFGPATVKYIKSKGAEAVKVYNAVCDLQKKYGLPAYPAK